MSSSESECGSVDGVTGFGYWIDCWLSAERCVIKEGGLHDFREIVIMVGTDDMFALPVVTSVCFSWYHTQSGCIQWIIQISLDYVMTS